MKSLFLEVISKESMVEEQLELHIDVLELYGDKEKDYKDSHTQYLLCREA